MLKGEFHAGLRSRIRGLERASVARLDEVSKLLVPCRMPGWDEAAAVRREIQFKNTVAANGLMVDVDHLVNRPERLIFPPEPPVTCLQGRITFRWRKIFAGRVPAVIGDSG